MNRLRVGVGAGIIIILVILGVYLLARPSSSPDTSPQTVPDTGKHQSGSQQHRPGSSTSSAANKPLSNTGPGNTLALFLGASALGYGFFIRRRIRAR